MVGIVNYGVGNLFSVANCIEKLGESCTLITESSHLSRVDRIILPGVGAFDQAMEFMKNRGLVEAIEKETSKGKPLLGICLGLQLLFEKSEEGVMEGLSLLKGKVKRFPVKKGFSVPHMGWNSVKLIGNFSRITQNIPQNTFFYFAHSFYPVPDEKDVISGITKYGVSFVSIVEKENIVGVQFHPEKSSLPGLFLIKNFIEWKC